MKRNRRLDLDTADRILSGAVAVDDAPPGFAGAVRTLHAARTGFVTDDEAVGLTSQVVNSTDAGVVVALRPRRPLAPMLTAKAGVIAAVVTLSATAAAAATGTLPPPAQDVVAGVVRHVGVTLPKVDDAPGTDDDSGTQPTQRGADDPPGHDAKDDGTRGRDSNDAANDPPGHDAKDDGTRGKGADSDDPGNQGGDGSPNDNHGSGVSGEAQDPTTTGGNHGEDVSGVGRDNNGQTQGSNGDDADGSPGTSDASRGQSDGQSKPGTDAPDLPGDPTDNN